MTEAGFWDRDEAKAKDTWQTPPELIGLLNKHVLITLDPCAGPTTNYAVNNWTIEGCDLSDDNVDGNINALDTPWNHDITAAPRIAFVNPPFSMKGKFIDKVREELDAGRIDAAIVLLPDATDVKSYWHDGVREIADYVWFSYGRQSFIDPETGEEVGSPTFGTTLHFCGDYEWPDSLFEDLNECGEVLQKW